MAKKEPRPAQDNECESAASSGLLTIGCSLPANHGEREKAEDKGVGSSLKCEFVIDAAEQDQPCGSSIDWSETSSDKHKEKQARYEKRNGRGKADGKVTRVQEVKDEADRHVIKRRIKINCLRLQKHFVETVRLRDVEGK